MTAPDDIENDVVALTCALRETRRHWRFDETGVPTGLVSGGGRVEAIRARRPGTPARCW